MNVDVQVALVTVFTTTIATLGVVAVALINRPPKPQKEEPKIEASVEDLDVLDRMLNVISENHRKETVIAGLRIKVRNLKTANRELEWELRRVKQDYEALLKRSTDGA